jgi:hypothetical protein
MTIRTLAEQQALMEAYDNAEPVLRDLLKEFDHDEIVKAGTAISSNDYEEIGRFLRATARLNDKLKMKLGDSYRVIHGRGPR